MPRGSDGFAFSGHVAGDVWKFVAFLFSSGILQFSSSLGKVSVDIPGPIILAYTAFWGTAVAL